MLLADKSDWNLSARRYRQRHAEEALGHEDALGVVSQRPVPEVRGDALGLVEKAVEGDVVVRHTAPAADRRERVVVRMSHDGLTSCAGGYWSR